MNEGGCWSCFEKTAAGRISFLEIPGDVDDDNPLISFDEEHEFEELDTLVVKQRFPPMADDELW